MLTHYVSIDLEMSGLSPVKDRIIEIAALRVENGKVTGRFETLINPNIPIREHITEITGIREDMLHQSPEIHEVMPWNMRRRASQSLTGSLPDLPGSIHR